jgi:hypothetical protein
VQKNGTQHRARDEPQAEQPERDARTPLEPLLHAGAALADKLAFD